MRSSSGHALVARELEHAGVELDPRELAVEQPRLLARQRRGARAAAPRRGSPSGALRDQPQGARAQEPAQLAARQVDASRRRPWGATRARPLTSRSEPGEVGVVADEHERTRRDAARTAPSSVALREAGRSASSSYHRHAELGRRELGRLARAYERARDDRDRASPAARAAHDPRCRASRSPSGDQRPIGVVEPGELHAGPPSRVAEAPFSLAHRTGATAGRPSPYAACGAGSKR